METDKYKPAVTKNFLLLIAGVAWECVGVLLLIKAISWLHKASGINIYTYTLAGILLALFVHHFGFLRIVDKNLNRILQMDLKKRCFFSFIPSRSYLIIIIMIIMGALLRHSIIPKYDLAVLYIGIGLALILSSVRYIRVFYREVLKNRFH